MSERFIMEKDIESDIQEDPWRKQATTTARFDLCFKCKFYAPQKPYNPGVRCRFRFRPEVIYEHGISNAKCDVFIKPYS